jgi:hypothetical protein
MIVDWVKEIQTILTDVDNKANAIEEIIKELNDILEAAWRLDTVIIRLKESLRIEICPLYTDEEQDIKSITKDFRELHEYNDIMNRKDKAEKDLLNVVKNDPDTLRLVLRYMEIQKTTNRLYAVSIIEKRDLKNYKKTLEIPIIALETYVGGLLGGLGIELPKRFFQETFF